MPCIPVTPVVVTADEGSLGFLSLPRELRDRVYSLVYGSEEEVHVTQNPISNALPNGSRRYPSPGGFMLMRTCRLIYEETPD